jgi:hypothetical protein
MPRCILSSRPKKQSRLVVNQLSVLRQMGQRLNPSIILGWILLKL